MPIGQVLKWPLCCTAMPIGQFISQPWSEKFLLAADDRQCRESSLVSMQRKEPVECSALDGKHLLNS